MKLHSSLTILSFGSVLATLIALSLNVAALPFFSAAVCTLILGVSVTDYRGPRIYGAAALAARKSRERMPLAA